MGGGYNMGGNKMMSSNNGYNMKGVVAMAGSVQNTGWGIKKGAQMKGAAIMMRNVGY